jgi:hypothetical protein
MNEQQLDRLVRKLDQEIIRWNQRPRCKRFEGVALIQALPGDSVRAQSLIAEHNHKARSYNALGGEMGRAIQMAIAQSAPRVRPQDDLLGVLDELLRLRLARHQSLLHDVEPRLHSLELRMKELLHGRRGIRDLAREISESRGASR